MPRRGRLTRAVGTVALLAALCGGAEVASAAEQCDARLTVELTPDVPNASDDGFLRSLLNNQTACRLELLRKDDASVVELDLRGPGPASRCESVIESMRKDARVQSIRVDSPQVLSAADALEAPPDAESAGTELSEPGLGALYWAAQHPRQAWRVLLPIPAESR